MGLFDRFKKKTVVLDAEVKVEVIAVVAAKLELRLTTAVLLAVIANETSPLILGKAPTQKAGEGL